MRVKVKNLKGEEFYIDAQHCDSVLDLKNRIKAHKGMAVDRQKLVFKGKVIEDTAIIADIGVKDEDNLVLMTVFPKKETHIQPQPQNKAQQNLSIQAKKEEEKRPVPDENMIKKLVKLGYEKDKAEEVLIKTGNNLKSAIELLFNKKKEEGAEMSEHEILKYEVLKNLAGNEEHLTINQNGELQISNIEGLLERNEELQQLLLNNPSALLNILINDNEDDLELQNQFSGNFEGDEEYLVDITFTEEEEQAMQRLVDLGFDRESVVQAYLSCDRNEEMAADLLFRQKQNNEFD